MGDGKLGDVERTRVGSEIHRHPLVPQTGVGTDPQDGMPRISSAVSMEDSKAPPLEPDTFVCMGDESVFVIADQWGEPLIRLERGRARRFMWPDGRNGWLASLSEKEREQAHLPICVTGSGDQWWFEVHPLRAQCEHYRRVMVDFEGDHQSPIRLVERSCAAQVSETGEFMSLGNTRVHACEHRSPRDFVSEERLRKFDQAQVDAAKKIEEPAWDPEAALKEKLKEAGEDP